MNAISRLVPRVRSSLRPNLVSQRRRRRLFCETLEERRLLAVNVFTVENLDDSGDGSLRQAIIDANTTPNDPMGPDEIVFDAALPAGTISLTTGELLIDDSVSIDGPGTGQLTINAGGTSRIFNVVEAPGQFLEVSISGVTLTDGLADDGGAVRNILGTLYISSSVLTGNSATRGGAIYTEGDGSVNEYGGPVATLIVDDTDISGNSAEDGGGIYNDFDHVELFNTTVTGNTASGDGGGIYTVGQGGRGDTLGTLLVENSEISSNTADGSGGGIYNEDDHVELYQSTVADNTAGVDGGGIYTLATPSNQVPQTLYVDESEIRGNTAAGTGGGIHNNSDSLDIEFSTIDGNQAAEGGGIFHSNPNTNFIYSYINASTISNNQAIATETFVGRGGGISVVGTPSELEIGSSNLSIENSTLSGNQADEDGGGLYVGVGSGGDQVRLYNATVANNAGECGGGIYHDGTGNVSLANSLVANNSATDMGQDVWGQFDSFSDYNLIGNGDDSMGIDAENNNQVGTTAEPIDPLIGPLQDNGGLTQTHALLADSPAIDAGNSFYSFDQRGLGRSDESTDIGAYERVFDFGDAPDFGEPPFNFPTLLDNDGAHHVIGALRLGSQIDNEADGQPTVDAGGDDRIRDPNFYDIDDEEGVVFVSSTVAGFTGAVEITASGAGFINAWMDVDGSGDWEVDEQIFLNVPVVAGVNVLDYIVPELPGVPANGDPNVTAYARFRLNSTGDLPTTGPAVDGEVEDYRLTVERVILPETGEEGFVFQETVEPRVRRWYDPEIAVGYDYTVNAGGDNFTEVELLPGFGDDLFTLEFDDGGVMQTVSIAASVPYNFETDGGISGGVSSFRITGIEISEMLDPDDPNAFPTGLSFGDVDNNNESIVDFLMTPLTSPVTGVSFVDANNNGILDDGDVELVAGELADGVFDTRRPEGGYTTRIRGAGLVVDGSPISAPNVNFSADGNLVINTSVTSTGPVPSAAQGLAEGRAQGQRHGHGGSDGGSDGGDDVEFRSRGGSVLLDDMTVDSFDSIEIRAADEISATRSRLTAVKNIDLSARGDINVDLATLTAGREIEVDSSRGDVSADVSLIQAGRKIELKASRGTVLARGSLLDATGDQGQVQLSGDVIDIGVFPGTDSPTVIKAAREIEIKARDQVLADFALLQACDGKVELDARNDISLENAMVRALNDIEIKSSRGNVDLAMADVAISGGTRGDIEIRGRMLLIEGATFTGPDRIKLRGQRDGDAEFVDGTIPC